MRLESGHLLIEKVLRLLYLTGCCLVCYVKDHQAFMFNFYRFCPLAIFDPSLYPLNLWQLKKERRVEKKLWPGVIDFH